MKFLKFIVLAGGVALALALSGHLAAAQRFFLMRDVPDAEAGIPDSSPESFSFTDLSDQPKGQTILSETVSLEYVNPSRIPLEVSISGDGNPEFSLDGGAFTSFATDVEPKSIRLRLTTELSGPPSYPVTVTVGSTQATWTVNVNTCDAGSWQTPVSYGQTSFTVPDGCTTVTAHMWGAGGGNSQRAGGAGGFTLVDIPVTPGESLIVWVGRAGVYAECTGSGGGMSAIFRGAADADHALAVAGGGGGAGGNQGQGGGGGGLVGNAYGGSPYGQGGTQSAGGARGCSSYCGGNGSSTYGAFTGGSGGYGGAGGGSGWQRGSGGACHPHKGGGGGAGWYGGGGGGQYGGGSNPTRNGYGGGGGSGYINTAAGVTGNTYAASGASETAQGQADPYVNGSCGDSQQHGWVVISYGD